MSRDGAARQVVELAFDVPPGVNNFYVNIPGRGRAVSTKGKAWRELAGYQLNRQRPPHVPGPVAIEIAISDAGRFDLDAVVKPTLDLLVGHGVIEDDNRLNAIGAPCSVSSRSRDGGRISTKRTSSRGRMQHCSNLSIATVARARKRSRWSTSTSTRAAKPSSETSRAGGGGFAPKREEQSHALAHAPGATMPSADTPRQPVPVASGEREEAVSDAR